jgi:hypothetical protein
MRDTFRSDAPTGTQAIPLRICFRPLAASTLIFAINGERSWNRMPTITTPSTKLAKVGVDGL